MLACRGTATTVKGIGSPDPQFGTAVKKVAI